MHLKHTKILVVDDHPFFLEGIKLGIESLKGLYYQVETVTSTTSALKYLSHTTDLDLILCDLNVPKMNGIEFIKHLFQQDIWIPIAIISASENPSDIHQAMREGAAGFINKSLNQKELASALTLILSGEYYVPDGYTPVANFEAPPPSPANAATDKLGITARQHDVLRLMAQGFTNKEISTKLGVAESTTKSHTKALFQILRVSNRTACTLSAARLNLIPDANMNQNQSA